MRFHEADHAAAARLVISRSILTIAIYELWGAGVDYEALHKDIRARTEPVWEQYRSVSFRFEVDSFRGSRSTSEQRELMESLEYMDFRGPIRMNKAEHHFTIFEDYKLDAEKPFRLFFGKQIAESGRKAVAKYSLKKRKYIATTSMDAELSLVTANMALSAPGKLGYDPFMGTGSFPLACAHFGSTVCGSDMDGRSIRGKKGRTVRANFEQYGTSSLYLDGFTADLTNTPLRQYRYLDSIVCDPPYGVREGLKVLGSLKPHLQEEVFLADGTAAHLGNSYIPPKRPYSFVRMLDDILDFGSKMLVDGGRLCMWMPVAGAVEDDAAAEAGEEVADRKEGAEVEEEEYSIPQHPALSLVSSCRQDFNKCMCQFSAAAVEFHTDDGLGSRRLLTYKRMSDSEVDSETMAAYQLQRLEVNANEEKQATADELNDFRRKVSIALCCSSLPILTFQSQYFQGFKS